MKRELSTTLGFYIPSFLRMHVGTKLSLGNLNKINDDYAESIYLHEYIHFIQDITTSYGLSNISIVVDYLKFANNYILSQGIKQFDVPVLPIRKADDNVYANRLLAKIYNGTGEDSNITLVSHFKLEKIVSTKSEVLRVPYIKVCYRKESSNVLDFEFGALCIVESMAYIIESECYPECEDSPELPYKSAEKLVELIFPEFGLDRLNILALCDASLKTFNPGPFFYDMLIYIRDNDVEISKPEDVYELISQIEVNFNGTRDFSALLEEMKINAINQITGYFNDPHFQPIKTWLKNMIESAVRHRLSNETFVLDIARLGKFSKNLSLAKFINDVGTPLVTNDNNELTLFDPNAGSTRLNYSTIWAIEQVHSIFMGFFDECELFEHCQQCGIETDFRCKSIPWERHSIPNCAFGQIWRHWALSGYMPRNIE